MTLNIVVWASIRDLAKYFRTTKMLLVSQSLDKISFSENLIVNQGKLIFLFEKADRSRMEKLVFSFVKLFPVQYFANPNDKTPNVTFLKYELLSYQIL